MIKASSKCVSEEHASLLTSDQQEVYDYCSMADRNERGMLFLDAPSGTGKTFLINFTIRNTASSEIAATLLTQHL